MSKALVTGGAGFIGSNVVKLLLAKGVDVIIQKVWHCPNTPHFDSEAAALDALLESGFTDARLHRAS